MGAPAKFLFDVDFSAPAKAREPAATPAEIAARVAQAEAQAYRAGFDAAQRESHVESEHRSAAALQQIGDSIAAIAARFAEIEGRLQTEAVNVAVATARKLSGALIAAEPLTEVVELVRDCFKHLVTTPHLVIRINDGLYEQAHEAFERMAKQSGFSGRLIVLAEPDIAAGDCKIEWADGGVMREAAAIDAKITELVARYIASHRHNATRTTP
ncbi:MAG: FliH/SctL family protein [Xanthobacteraceae bacterium]|nr:FliH/SctL family protein [Xanthobacteraceae bacterium]